MTESNFDLLYKELAKDLEEISNLLFEFGEQQIRKHGMYLPFGATMNQGREVVLTMATNGEDVATSDELMPLLVEGLRNMAKETDILAAATCEWVQITTEGKTNDAMKVIVEHSRGLSVAFYVPCNKSIFRGWRFLPMIAKQIAPVIVIWNSKNACQQSIPK